MKTAVSLYQIAARYDCGCKILTVIMNVVMYKIKSHLRSCPPKGFHEKFSYLGSLNL